MSDTITQRDVDRAAARPVHSRPQAAIAFLWRRTARLQEAWEVAQTVGEWPGAAIVPDRGGVCLTLGDVRLGHLLWNGRIELPFGAEAADQLIAEEMAISDPCWPHTSRVVFEIRSADDVNRALWLFRFAYLVADSSAAGPAVQAGCA
jgi:hypothetical protein